MTLVATVPAAPEIEIRTESDWPAFSRTWAAHGVSSFGDHFTMVALPIATFARTGSALSVGVVAAMQGITVLLFGLAAGVIADRVSRRRLLVLTDLFRGATLAALAGALVWNIAPVGAIFLAAFVLGALRVLHDAAEVAVVPLLVEGSDLLRANGRVHASDSAATAAGPAAAGGLLSVGGVALAFVGDALSFFVSAFAVRGVRRIDDGCPPPGSSAPVVAEVRDGLRALWADAFVMRALVVVAAMNVVATAAEAQFIPYAREVLGLGSTGVGLYFALGGLVAVGTAMIAGRRRIVRGDALLFGVGVFASGFLLAGLAPSLATAALAFVGAGFGSALTLTHWYSLRHKRFPLHLLGRVSVATRMAITAAVPVAYIAGGWFAHAYGPDALYVVVSVVGLGAVAWGLATGLARLRID